MEHADISGVEYQQGELQGYEVREYLLETWGRMCAYGGMTDGPFEVEPIVPKSRGGSNRVSNLTIACRRCNDAKGQKTAAEFGHPEIEANANAPLKAAAAVNATRWALVGSLKATGLPVECGTGGRMKWKRIRLGLPKEHWIDAACVGASTPNHLVVPESVLTIKAVGHGNRQRCGTDQHGVPIRHRSGASKHFGFETGDVVRGVVPLGKRRGVHVGRVLCRATGSFDIQTNSGRVAGISWRHCQVLHRNDGYTYEEGGASSPRLKLGASAPQEL